MQIHYSCDSCDADFKIKHSMNETYYEVNFCPFCGASIENVLEEDEDIDL